MIRQGYSLLELLVVMTLAVGISLMIGLSFFSFDSWIVKAELDTLYAASRYMQIQAQLERSDKEIFFNQENHSYSVDGKIYKLPKQVLFSGALDAQGPPSDPYKTIIDPITFIGKKIHFFADGTVQAGSVYLSDRSKKCLYALTVPIGHAGVMRMYRYRKEVPGWVAL